MKTPWISAACVLLAVAAGCTSTQISLPAVTETPTDEHQTGRMIWRDLISSKPAESRRFYEELFGWEFEAVGNLFGLGGNDTYALIRNNGRLIGGMVDENQLAARADNISQWVVLMSVTDIDAAVGRLEREGGTVLTPPTEVAKRGRMAVVTDPQGALLALLQTASGDPVEHQPGLGDFLWDELWTSDPGAATTFYESLAGYEANDVALEDGGSYRALQTGGEPQAGVLAHPFPGERPVWVTYVRVEDPAAITARVEALGGKIYVDAMDRPLGGQVALIADPSGAGIALQSWTFEDQGD